MARSTVHYADKETNRILKKLHNKLRPAGTPVQRVEYIIELLLLRIFEVKLKQSNEFKELRQLFTSEDEHKLFSFLLSVPNDKILPELNINFFPFYSQIIPKARKVYPGNFPLKVQDQLVLIEEVFSNSNFTNNVTSGNLAEVISLVQEIDEERLLQTDLLGDAIESSLSESGGTKELGLFRTPDHIRQFMVGLVEPDFNDIIFDPACGTGGFLFDSYEFVNQRVSANYGEFNNWLNGKAHPELKAWFDNYFENNKLEFPPADLSNKFYRTGISGFEYLGMIRKMAAINFYVRGLNPHNIQQGDSLAKFIPVEDAETKTIVIANPPFGAERDQEAYPDVWSEYAKESETTILFVKLMFEHLKKGGTCAVIVSEGFHTWDQFSAKALRKMLLEDANLKAIISLPQGVFVSKNGPGPKTSILLFEKGSLTDKVWFYKVTNDGYTMGTNRKQIPGCQLVECLDIYHAYITKGIEPPLTKHSFLIPAEWIKRLDPRIKEKIRIDTTTEMELKRTEEKEKLLSALKFKLADKKIAQQEYDSEILKFDLIWQSKISNEISKRIEKAHNFSFNLVNYKSNLKEAEINDWNNYLLKHKVNHVSTQSNLDSIYNDSKNIKSIKDLLTLLSNLDITNALDLDIAREILNNYSEKFEDKQLQHLQQILRRKSKYPFVKLVDYIHLNEEKIKPSKYKDKKFKVLGVSNEIGIFINEEAVPEDTSQSYFLAKKNEFCYNPYRINVGSIGLNEFDYENQIISGAYVVFSVDENDIHPKYLDALFKSNQFMEYVNEKSNGGVRMNFKFEYLQDWEIPLPNFDEQIQIVEQLEIQKEFLTGANKILNNWVIDFGVDIKHFHAIQLGALTIDSLYGTSNKADYQTEGYGVLRINNIQNMNIVTEDLKFTELSEEDFYKYQIKEDDLLIVRSNGNPEFVGKCAVSEMDTNLVYASYLIRFRFDELKVKSKYIMYYLHSSTGRQQITPTAGGGTYNFNSTDFQTIKIPLPPLAIQQNIIDKLDSEKKFLGQLSKMCINAKRKISDIVTHIWL